MGLFMTENTITLIGNYSEHPLTIHQKFKCLLSHELGHYFHYLKIGKEKWYGLNKFVGANLREDVANLSHLLCFETIGLLNTVLKIEEDLGFNFNKLKELARIENKREKLKELLIERQ